MDIGAALSSIGISLDIAKTLHGISKDFDASTYKITIADLTTNLAEAKLALVDVRDDIAAKNKEIDRLLSEFQLKGTLVERSGFRFFTDEAGNLKGCAVCPRCEGVDGRLIQVVRKHTATGFVNTCPQCKQDYDGRESRA